MSQLSRAQLNPKISHLHHLQDHERQSLPPPHQTRLKLILLLLLLGLDLSLLPLTLTTLPRFSLLALGSSGLLRLDSLSRLLLTLLLIVDGRVCLLGSLAAFALAFCGGGGGGGLRLSAVASTAVILGESLEFGDAVGEGLGGTVWEASSQRCCLS